MILTNKQIIIRKRKLDS